MRVACLARLIAVSDRLVRLPTTLRVDGVLRLILILPTILPQTVMRILGGFSDPVRNPPRILDGLPCPPLNILPQLAGLLSDALRLLSHFLLLCANLRECTLDLGIVRQCHAAAGLSGIRIAITFRRNLFSPGIILLRLVPVLTAVPLAVQIIPNGFVATLPIRVQPLLVLITPAVVLGGLLLGLLVPSCMILRFLLIGGRLVGYGLLPRRITVLIRGSLTSTAARLLARVLIFGVFR